MQLIAVNHVEAEERRAALPSDWDVHVTDTPIGETYFDLTQIALEREWGLETVIIQDDVRFTEDPVQGEPNGKGNLVVYGQGDERHVCPRAFAADQYVWKILGISWAMRPPKLCPWFLPVVSAFGEVRNQTTHLGAPG